MSLAPNANDVYGGDGRYYYHQQLATELTNAQQQNGHHLHSDQSSYRALTQSYETNPTQYPEQYEFTQSTQPFDSRPIHHAHVSPAQPRAIPPSQPITCVRCGCPNTRVSGEFYCCVACGLSLANVQRPKTSLVSHYIPHEALPLLGDSPTELKKYSVLPFTFPQHHPLIHATTDMPQQQLMQPMAPLPVPPPSLLGHGRSKREGSTESAASSSTTTTRKTCSTCSTTETSLWRRSSLTGDPSCNACWQYFRLHGTARPLVLDGGRGGKVYPRVRQSRVKDRKGNVVEDGGGSSSSNNNSGKYVDAECYNCRTKETSMWRRDLEGNTVCNSCGLYYRLYGIARPDTLPKEIRRRRRVPKGSKKDGSKGKSKTEAVANSSRAASMESSASPAAEPQETEMVANSDEEDALDALALLASMSNDVVTSKKM